MSTNFDQVSVLSVVDGLVISSPALNRSRGWHPVTVSQHRPTIRTAAPTVFRRAAGGGHNLKAIRGKVITSKVLQYREIKTNLVTKTSPTKRQLESESDAAATHANLEY
jgi:hypothetical protein